MTAPRDDWIDKARAISTGAILGERGILGNLKGRNGIFAGPCPVCGGKDRFGVDLRKGNGGLFNCRGCGVGGGDAISLVRFLDGCDFLRAVETLAGPPPSGKRETAEERRAREQHALERCQRLERERREREQREAEELRQQHEKAAWLWAQRQPITGTIAETYLREARGITCALPATLAYLPPRKPEHHPAMIAAFALADEVAAEDNEAGEIEPGILASPRDVQAVHLTLLKPDGSGKAEMPDDKSNKIIVGSSVGSPIVIAPLNDLLGLAITEGIEDALTARQATGLGAWAAGAAFLMPKLIAAIDDLAAREYDASPECVTIFADDDKAGRDNARALAAALRSRGIEIVVEGL